MSDARAVSVATANLKNPVAGDSDDAPSQAVAAPTIYSILSQSRADLDDPSNSPSVSMWPYLVASGQTKRLTEISIYAGHGLDMDAIRFLYMNDFALTIWREMARPFVVVGRLRRPPRGTVLSFGMPFSE